MEIEIIKQKINKGIPLGYSEFSQGILLEYALKKLSTHKYMSYFFKIPIDKLHLIEDYGEEQVEYFDNIDEALEKMTLLGGELTKFTIFKKSKPI